MGGWVKHCHRCAAKQHSDGAMAQKGAGAAKAGKGLRERRGATFAAVSLCEFRVGSDAPLAVIERLVPIPHRRVASRPVAVAHVVVGIESDPLRVVLDCLGAIAGRGSGSRRQV